LEPVAWSLRLVLFLDNWSNLGLSQSAD